MRCGAALRSIILAMSKGEEIYVQRPRAAKSESKSESR